MNRCARCGAEYPDDFDDLWGSVEETSGYGKDPVCIALVEDKRAPRAQDGSAAQAVCRGRLIAVEGEPSKERGKELRPINPNHKR